MADNHNVNARITSIHKDVLTQMGLTTSEGGVISGITQLVDSQGNAILPTGVPYTQSIELTRPANVTEYTALDAVSSTTASVKQKETFTFTGTGGTATVTTGSLVHTATFNADIQQTVIDFESLIVLDYAAAGLTVTRNLEDIIVEAAVAGVPFSAPVIENVTGDLDGTVTHTTANYTAIAHELENMALVNGGGGIIKDVKIETNITTFAGKGFRIWLYNEYPSAIVGDNVAFTNAYADRDKLIGYIDVTMEALLTGSDSVVGQASPSKLYKCADTSLFVQLETKDTVVPTNGGKINLTFNVLK